MLPGSRPALHHHARKRPVLDLALALALALSLTALTATAASPTAESLTPHSARFAVKYRGMDAGTSDTRLETAAPGPDGRLRFSFTNRSVPKGLAALFLPGTITQRTQFTYTADGVRPEAYRLEDGSHNTRRDVRLDFDWAQGRVTGVAEDKPVDLPLSVGLQDALTISLQVRWLLQQGRSPQRLVMIEKDQTKDYDYVFAGHERLNTALGPLDTVIWRSSRPGSDRITRTWYAPTYGYLPVKAEQTRRGQPLMSFSVSSYQP